MPLWRRIGIVVVCGLIVLGAVILVAHFVQARQPGQASSGSVTVSQAQQIEEQLQQALTLNNKGNAEGALVLYDKVLSEDPSNPAALAYAGYLQWNMGSQSHVASLVAYRAAEIQTAVKDSPTYYQAHLFDGLVLENQDHNDKAAVAQFNDFLADGPPATELSQVEPLVLGAYEAGDPVPAALTTGPPRAPVARPETSRSTSPVAPSRAPVRSISPEASADHPRPGEGLGEGPAVLRRWSTSPR